MAGIIRLLTNTKYHWRPNAERAMKNSLLRATGITNNPEAEDFDDTKRIFRHPSVNSSSSSSPSINLICSKVLYHGTQAESIARACNLQLTQVQSREILVKTLDASLKSRINFVASGRDLRRSNSSNPCIDLGSSNDVTYQLGIISNGKKSFEIYTTDSIGSIVLYQPFNQGSSYNEYKFPHSDLNLGMHLIHSCLLGQSAGLDGPLNLKLAPYQIVTDYVLLPLLFILIYLLACLISASAIIIRTTGDRESGFHKYARTCGVSSLSYWLAEILVILIQTAIQTLLVSFLLSIPAADHLMDPIYLMPITLRYLFLFSTTSTMLLQSLLLATLYDKTGHGLLIHFLAIIPTGVYFIFSHQYNAYGFTYMPQISGAVQWFFPVTLFDSMVIVLLAIHLQTGGQSLTWSNLEMGVLGGGYSEKSLAQLWVQLLIVAISHFILIILIDQIRFTPKLTPWGLIINSCTDLFPLGKRENKYDDRSLTGAPNDLVLKRVNGIDPNRICCSIRDLNIDGRNGFVAQTHGNLFKGAAHHIKHHQYRVSPKSSHNLITSIVSPSQTSGSPSPSSTLSHEQSSSLNDAIRQHLYWTKHKIGLYDLNLDFRYNQVNYIIGPTDLKELLINSLLGLHPIDSGSIIIDGQQYDCNTIAQARPFFGHLGEEDVYIRELSIIENIELFSCLRNPDVAQDMSESQFLLSLLHLGHMKDERPSVLTNRSSRKMALAVAAVGNSKLLLLVEPTLNLRYKPRAQVLNLLKKYKSIRSIIVDTSDIDEAASFADRIIFLRNGHSDLDGSPHQIMQRLNCGFRVLFEQIGVHDINQFDAQKVQKLEQLTTDLFKGDKIGTLDASDKSDTIKTKLFIKPTLSSPTLVQKIHHSQSTMKDLVKLWTLFDQNNNNHHGFRLVETNYESLEDILVKRMSKASYPDLPPDLLVALSYRNQAVLLDPEESPASFRKLVGDFQMPRSRKSLYHASISEIILDRLTMTRELFIYLMTILISAIALLIVLVVMKTSLKPTFNALIHNYDNQVRNSINELTKMPSLQSTLLDSFYQNRIGLFIMDKIGNTSNRRKRQSKNKSRNQRLIDGWRGNPKISGYFSDRSDNTLSDEHFMADVVQLNMDTPAAIIFTEPDPGNGRATIVYEPYSPRALIHGIKVYADFLSIQQSSRKMNQTTPFPPSNVTQSLTQTTINSTTTAKIATPRDRRRRQIHDDRKSSLTQNFFPQPWTEMIRGYSMRRLFYGIGLSIAEAISLGMVILASHRHRFESTKVTFKIRYWIAMFIFDLIISIVQICLYISVISMIDVKPGTYQIVVMFLMFIIYKFAYIPFAYIISVVSQSTTRAWLFLSLFVISTGWTFGVNLRTFFEWIFLGYGNSYVIFDWMLLFNPIVSLIDATSTINHVARINELCKQVPAFIATRPLVELEGVQSLTLNEILLAKVDECLSSGKQGVSTGVFHTAKLGIIWDMILTLLFAIIVWLFLIYNQKVLGILVHRFIGSERTRNLMKSVVRSPESSSETQHKWEREKDRLVSQYLHFMTDVKHAKLMTNHCLLLRIWLKPIISNEMSIERRISMLLEPLTGCGLQKGDYQIELKTSLQIFIRIGNDRHSLRNKRIQLVEAYTNLSALHGDTVARFVVIDYTQESLYKILLHGHYNIKSTQMITT